VAELSRQLQQDRLRGHAVSESFFERGISAVAAPVRDGSARVVASLSITVSQPRIEPASRRERLVQQVMQAADTLSHRLNYRPAEQLKTHHHADKESA
jgi:DNA-binding IclR family transcriptional regulator